MGTLVPLPCGALPAGRKPVDHRAQGQRGDPVDHIIASSGWAFFGKRPASSVWICSPGELVL
jgi:hypothetical protein